MFYKNVSSSAKTFYGETFNPGETKEVNKYINSKWMILVESPDKEAQKKQTKPSSEPPKKDSQKKEDPKQPKGQSEDQSKEQSEDQSKDAPKEVVEGKKSEEKKS